jgi:hypothetical protein
MPIRTAKDGLTRTQEAVGKQLGALKSALYEVGLYRPAVADNQPEMLPRTWDASTLVKSIPWLRWQNSQGRNIYIRPAGEHQFSLVDDLVADNLDRMGREGFPPCVVVETSPDNFQAWLNHGEVLPRDVSTLAARALARKFGGDQGAADWRHFGRLSGFTNRKPSRQAANGLYPFVHLIEARNLVYPLATEFVGSLREHLAQEAKQKQRLHERFVASQSPLAASLTIEDFRCDARYAGDGNRVDLAYAVYALSHGASENDVQCAIASRDLTKKGSAKRQEQYIARTVEKARSIARPSSRDRCCPQALKYTVER